MQMDIKICFDRSLYAIEYKDCLAMFVSYFFKMKMSSFWIRKLDIINLHVNAKNEIN